MDIAELFWTCAGNLSAIVTLKTELIEIFRGIADKNQMELDHINTAIDYSKIPPHLELSLEKVEKYMNDQKSEITGQNLFSQDEKDKFISDIFIQYPVLRQYKSEIESVLHSFLIEVESYLKRHMSIGEIVLYKEIKKSEYTLQSVLEAMPKGIQKGEKIFCSANQDYIKSFEESLFLHKDSKTVNLKNLFVLQKYTEPRRCGSIPQEDLCDRLEKFIQQESRAFMFIEGDAGTGKSSLVSWINYHVYHEDEVGKKLLGHKRLLTIRMRDLQKKTIVEQDSLIPAILEYTHIPSLDYLEKLYPKALVILDGFDELCLINQIVNYEALLYDLWRKSPVFHNVIITTRPKYIALGKIDIPHQFIKLQHFDSENRKDWIKRFISSEYCNQTIDSNIKEYIENISSTNTSIICDTPMSLYMLSAQRFDSKTIENPWRLYHQIFYKELSETDYNQMFPNAERNYEHAVIKVREYIYRISEEISYKMYCSQNSKLYISSNELYCIIESLSKQEPMLLMAQRKDIIARCYALCAYWKSYSNAGFAEFYHNNIRDFFLCEKIFREIIQLYNEWNNKERNNIKNIAERAYTLFQHSQLNPEVCRFLIGRSCDNAELETNDSVNIQSYFQFFADIFELLLKDWHIYNFTNDSDPMKSISNTLSCMAQMIRCICAPYLHNNRIVWWNNVDEINKSWLIKYLYRAIFSCEIIQYNQEFSFSISYQGDFSRLDLSSLDLSKAKSKYSSFQLANLNNSILYLCDFEHADFYNASLEKVDGHKTIFVKAKMNNCKMKDSDFAGANFTETSLVNAELVNVDLSGAILKTADLERAKLIDSDLRGANLSNANLHNADLTNVILTGAILTGAKFYNTNLSRANLRGLNLHKFNLAGINLSYSNLCDANLFGGNLSNANLSGANLTNADLSEATIINTNLSGANLSGTDLSSADLTGANLSNATLINTQLPDGFCSSNQEIQISHLKLLAIPNLIV